MGDWMRFDGLGGTAERAIAVDWDRPRADMRSVVSLGGYSRSLCSCAPACWQHPLLRVRS